MKQAILRRGLALLLAAAALGTVLAGAGADSAAALWQSVSRRPHLSRGLLRWELGDLLGLDGLLSLLHIRRLPTNVTVRYTVPALLVFYG